METIVENTLPQPIIDYIESLNPDTLGLDAAGTLEFYLAYGSEEEVDGRLEQLNSELALSTEDYISDLEISLDQLACNQWPGYVKSYHSKHKELLRWLAVSQRYLPGAEDEVMAELVDYTTESFDPRRLEMIAGLAVTDPASDETTKSLGRMHKMAQELSHTTLCDLYAYTTNIQTLERLLYSDFMQAFGDEFDRLTLQAHILELGGDQRSLAHANLVTEAAKLVTLADWHVVSARLEWIAQRDPMLAFQLTQDHPKILKGVQAFGHMILEHVDLEDPTNKMNSLIGLGDGADGVKGYCSFVGEHSREAGSFKPEHISNFKAIGKAIYRGYSFLYETLYAHLAINEAVALAEQHPESLSDQARTICVRRFAAEGYIEKAYELARSPISRPLDSIHNLLAIYDETGQEAAYFEANQRLLEASESKERFDFDDADAHELLARTFAAARRHGHLTRMEEAAAEMEPYYSHKESCIGDAALSRMVGIELDTGNIEMAEAYAVRLQSSRRVSYNEDNKNEIMYVLKAYMKAGDMTAAVRLAQTYFATTEPDRALPSAITLLNNEELKPMPFFLPRHRHLNPLASIKPVR